MAIGNQIPRWLHRSLNRDDLQRISKAVGKVEARTTGEIIPMVVRSSTSFGHVPVILTLILFAAGIIMDLHFLPVWMTLPLWLVAPLLLVVCFFAALVLSRTPWLCRVLTSDRDEKISVALRAELEFYRGSYAKTEHSTAILLFVSWIEHRAYVLADRGIAEKLPAETWQQVVDLLVQGLKQGRFVEGWERAIERSGAILAEHFPASGHPKNEIIDALVIKD